MNTSQPFRVVISFLVLSLVGLGVAPYLNVNLLPQHKSSILKIDFGLAQTPPQLVERYLTSPLENIFSRLSDLKTISSVSNYNRGQIILEFDYNTDMDFKRLEVFSLIRQIYPTLPFGTSYPQVTQENNQLAVSSSPLLIYSIHAPLALHQIKKIGEDNFQLYLSQVRGVDHIEITGAQSLQISVVYDPEKMLKYNITRSDIQEALVEYSDVQELGFIQSFSGNSLSLRINQPYIELSNLENLPLKMISKILDNEELENYTDTGVKTQIYLRDVAEIYQEEQSPSSYLRVNGLNAVNIIIWPQGNVNQLQLAKHIKNRIQELQKNISDNLNVSLEYDQTAYLYLELNKLYKRSFLSVTILLSMIVFIKLSIRYLFVLVGSLLVNLSLAILFYHLLSIEIHLYSLAGITLSLGFILDNSIIMVDHLHKKKNSRVFIGVLGASLTTISALLLIFLLPLEDRLNLSEFVLVIVINLFASLLVALFFTPALYNLIFPEDSLILNFPKAKKKQECTGGRNWFSHVYYKMLLTIHRFRFLFGICLILLFGIPVFMMPAQLVGQKWYNNTLGTPEYQENIRPYLDKILGGTLRLFVQDVFENASYRTLEKTKLIIRAEMTQGATLTQMNDIVREIEYYLQTVEGIDKFISQVHSGQLAQIEISFQQEYENSPMPHKLKSRLIIHSQNWGGVSWVIQGVGEGFANNQDTEFASFRVIFKGYQYEELDKQVQNLARQLLAHKRIQQVNTHDRLNRNEKFGQEFALNWNKHTHFTQRIYLSSIQDALDFYSLISQASLSLNINHKPTPVLIKSKNAKAFTLHQLTEGKISLPSEEELLLSTQTTLIQQNINNALHKEDRKYIRIIGFDYYGGHQFGKKYLKDVLEEINLEIPPELFEENASSSVDKTSRQYSLIIILIIAIYLICSILFESLKQPFLIILTIPVSFIGLFSAFAWGNFYFDQGGYAAFILLGGLVANASIFIINDFNNLQYIKTHNERVIKAILGKAQPILLTILSTSLGLLPFLTEGETEVFWFSLAIGSIGGLIFSLFVVFICLPVWMLKKDSYQNDQSN